LNDKISDKDKQAWENFLSSGEKLDKKDFKLIKKKKFKNKKYRLAWSYFARSQHNNSEIYQ
jgi:hypothetical protein